MWINHLVILLRAKSPEDRRFYVERGEWSPRFFTMIVSGCFFERFLKYLKSSQFSIRYFGII